jgi:hypothetical protein
MSFCQSGFSLFYAENEVPSPERVVFASQMKEEL